jgi:collagenase-like PrtC family protease
MAPFIVNHPTLLNNWIMSREIALKEIREIKKASKNEIEIFNNSLKIQ